jgi:hypothetical protein
MFTYFHQCVSNLDSVVDNLILGSGLDSENEEDDGNNERAEQAAETAADNLVKDRQHKPPQKKVVISESLVSDDYNISM